MSESSIGYYAGITISGFLNSLLLMAMIFVIYGSSETVDKSVIYIFSYLLLVLIGSSIVSFFKYKNLKKELAGEDLNGN